jgi:hypothetical protein
MKRISSILICLLFSFQFAYAQVNGSAATDIKNNTHDYYYLKHKKQQKIGWILLGAGLAATVTGGILSMSGGFSSGPTSQGQTGTVILGIGLTSSLVSIPFLISSGSNKRKARKFTDLDVLNPEKVSSDYFNLRYKKQKKVGWILLGSGVALALTGIIINANPNEYYDDYTGTVMETPSPWGEIFLVTGALTSLVSVPFLISSGSNKKKANAFVGSENIGFNQLPNFKSTFVSIGLLIDL